MQQDFTGMRYDRLPNHAIIAYQGKDLETSKNALGDATDTPGEYSSTLLEITPLDGNRYQLRLVAGTLKPRYKTYWYKVLDRPLVDSRNVPSSRQQGKTFRGVSIE
jgi:hypothetical protein